jgi:hypothetical protein
MPKLLYMDLPNLRSKKTTLNNREKSDHNPSICLQSDQPEEIPYLEGLKLAKRTIGTLKILKGLTIHLDPYPGYYLKWSLYPKAALTFMLFSIIW